MTPNAIEIAGLKKTYAATGKSDAKTALHGIDLNIPRGAIFGLLGPNGAGKSTLINILAGLVTKTEGSVKIWGFDQDSNPRALRNMLWDNVRALNAQGVTIILTTHYLEEAEAICDDIGIINHGKLIVRDSTANLLGRLDHKTLVISPASDSDLPPLPPTITGAKRDDGKLAFTYQSSVTSADAVLDLIRNAQIEIKDITTEQSDLEDVFLALTKN